MTIREELLELNEKTCLFAAAPDVPGDDLGSVPAAEVLPPERDTVTLGAPVPDAPYVFVGLDDETFHSTLSGFVEQAKGQYAEFGLTLYHRILPGLHDAQRRFTEHKSNPAYRLNGCNGIEEYIRKLGLTPARVRKWRQRDKERQFTREIKLLVGGNGTCQECGKGKGHAPSCSHYEQPLSPPKKETEAAILAEQCLRMTTTLLGPSVEPLPERVKKVIRMAESVQEAAAGGSYESADFAAPLSSPEPQRKPLPEPDPGGLDELGQRISRMADTDDIVPAVQTYLDHLFEPLHDGGLVLKFIVSARRAGRERIDFGDWVELIPYRGTDKQMGRVVGRDKLRRPVIRWFHAGAWQKPRSLFNNSGGRTHVLSAEEAQGAYPDVFASYRPTNAEMETSLATLSVPSPPADQTNDALKGLPEKPAALLVQQRPVDPQRPFTAKRATKPQANGKENVTGEEPNPKSGQNGAKGSKIVHETNPGGPKVLEVAIPGEFPSDPPRLKYYVCDGEQKHPHPTLDGAKAACDKLAEQQSQKQRNEQAKKQTVRAQGVAQRYRLAERTIGDLRELVVLDGDKVYDCYPLDATQEAQATVDRLNMSVVAEKPQAAMAAD